MRHRLGDIAKIKTGLFIKPETEGELVYLQVRHFNEEGKLRGEIFPDLKYSETSNKHLLSVGDILFAAKGSKNFAVVYEKHFPPAVASTSFFVIQIVVDDLMPDFVAWYINQWGTLNQLKDRATGTAIPSISKAIIEDLIIPKPDKALQKTILHIDALMNREEKIARDLIELRKAKIQKQIYKLLK